MSKEPRLRSHATRSRGDLNHGLREELAGGEEKASRGRWIDPELREQSRERRDDRRNEKEHEPQRGRKDDRGVSECRADLLAQRAIALEDCREPVEDGGQDPRRLARLDERDVELVEVARARAHRSGKRVAGFDLRRDGAKRLDEPPIAAPLDRDCECALDRHRGRK